MKPFITIGLLFVSFICIANPYTDPEVFPNVPTQIYVPQGFDTNDNVEIFFEGEFMNACYKVGMTLHTVDEESKSIYITDFAHYYGDAFCASVIVPYQKGVNAGMLTQGEYKVFFRHSRGNFVESEQVPIRVAQTSQADDHLYAPVKSVHYLPGKNMAPGKLRLMGSFMNTCMRLDDIRINVHRGKNVVDILPIAMMERGGCKDLVEGRPFQHDVELPELGSGRFLLHVRALNGQSVNDIISVRQ